MAAATALFMSLKPGDHVVAPSVMYWSLRNWLNDFARTWGLDVEFVPSADLDALAKAMRPGKTALVWLETPSNPLWDVTDIQSASDIAHKAGLDIIAFGNMSIQEVAQMIFDIVGRPSSRRYRMLATQRPPRPRAPWHSG